MTSFTEKLDPDALKFFNEVCKRPFAQQAVAFLNAYWPEVHTQAEFIYCVAWEMMKYADMHSKGVSLLYLYEEGTDVDFNIGLYFYEKLCKFLEDPKNAHWAGKEFAVSQPEMMTAIKRKQELREKVDINFDGRVSMLEYLLYQYMSFANPADFCIRSMGFDEHPEIRKARLALEEVSKRVKAFEAEKARLEAEAELPGVKGLGAKNMLAQLENNPLKEELNASLIKAEAAVRKATKMFGGGASANLGAPGEMRSAPTEGAIWWMNRELEEKKKRYGKK